MTDDNIPDILYKYIDIEGGVSMLNTEQLWFTRAMSLNDPYDCYHTSNFTGDYNDFSVEFDYNVSLQFSKSNTYPWHSTNMQQISFNNSGNQAG